jgi:hypothetical protein
MTPPTVPPLHSELEAELANLQPKRTRQPVQQWLIAMVLSAVYVAALTVVLGLRRDWVELPAMWRMAVAAIWVAGLALPLWLLLVPSTGKVVGRWRWASAVALLSSLALLAINIGWNAFGPSSFSFAQTPWRGHGCIEIGTGVAMVPAIVAAIVMRGIFPVGGRTVAAVIGASAGSLGGLCLHLHCRVADSLHLVLFHGGSVVLATALSWLLAPIILDMPWNVHRRSTKK